MTKTEEAWDNHSPAKTRSRQWEPWAQPHICKSKTETGKKFMHNQSPTKARPRLGEAYSQPQPSKDKTEEAGPQSLHRKGKTKTGESWAQPQPSKGKTLIGETSSQPQPRKGKTKTGGRLSTTTAQQRKAQGWGNPRHNHLYICRFYSDLDGISNLSSWGPN